MNTADRHMSDHRVYQNLSRFWSANLQTVTPHDKSNGYEEIASIFSSVRGRNLSGVGASVVAGWSRMLPPGASVLDLGCGTGVPISQVLIDRGFNVYGVDASPTMVAAFRDNFPKVPVDCSAVEDSGFFGRPFNAVVAWGLIFLLDVKIQFKLIGRVSGALLTGGGFLFTAPMQSCSWRDTMTGRPSVSLGQEAYQKALEAEGMSLVGTYTDEGENYYYSAQKI
jgi:SAM-dependent methyltransferase